MPKIWLITGAGNGLGRDITEAALAAGDSVVATARRTAELDDLVAQYGSRIHPFTLDVRDEPAAAAAVQAAIDTYGRVDVLVNNAGYGYFAPFEQMTPEQFKGIVDTCFWGVVYTTRAAIPHMRKQRSGHIFQVSSIGGRIAMPGNSPYHAAKWAVGGFSDSVGIEVAPFGVHITTLEPGGIRTNWAHRAGEGTPELLPDYQPSVGPLLEMLAKIRGNTEGDPKRIAQVILDLSNRDDTPARLILGKDAEMRVNHVETQRAETAAKWRDVTHSTAFPDAPKIDWGLKK